MHARVMVMGVAAAVQLLALSFQAADGLPNKRFVEEQMLSETPALGLIMQVRPAMHVHLCL